MALKDNPSMGKAEATTESSLNQWSPRKTRNWMWAALLGLNLGAMGVAKAETHSQCKDDPACENLFLDYRPSIEMDEKEQGLMQSSQEVLYRHLSNMSFVMYIEKMGGKKLMDALEYAVSAPHELMYAEKMPRVIVIAKRPLPGSGLSNGEFNLRIENGIVVEINGIRLDSRGWYSQEKAVSKYRETVITHTKCVHEVVGQPQPKGKGRGAQAPVPTRTELKCETVKKVHNNFMDQLDEDYLNAFQLRLPHQIKRLLELRSKGGFISAAENPASNESLGNFLEALKGHPEHLGQMDEEGQPMAPTVRVNFPKETPGIIEILDASNQRLLMVNQEGYLLAPNEEDPNKWELGKDYKDALKRRYREQLAAKKSK